MITSSGGIRCTAGGSARAATATCITSCDAFISLGRRAGPRSFRQRYGRHVCVRVRRGPQVSASTASASRASTSTTESGPWSSFHAIAAKQCKRDVREPPVWLHLSVCKPTNCNQPIATNQPTNHATNCRNNAKQCYAWAAGRGTKPQFLDFWPRDQLTQPTMA